MMQAYLIVCMHEYYQLPHPYYYINGKHDIHNMIIINYCNCPLLMVMVCQVLS